MTVSLKDWLESLEKELYERIKRSRRYANFVDEVICNKEDFYIWKKGSPNTTRIEGHTTIIELGPLQTKLVSPIPINLKISGDWRSRYEQKAYMGVLLGDLCRDVTIREEQIIVHTLMKNVKAFEIDNGTFSLDGLRDAINHISSQGNFADTILVNPMQLVKLREKSEFIPYYNLWQKSVEEKGYGFIGLLSHLSVYATAVLSESIGLIYEKRETKVRKTPLSIKFDDYNNPKTLNIVEDMLAWTTDDGALAKITLKA